MWENSSSRACSNGVGVDILGGCVGFLAMAELLLSRKRPGTRGRGVWERAVALAADQWAAQCNKALETAQRAAPEGGAWYYHGAREPDRGTQPAGRAGRGGRGGRGRGGGNGRGRGGRGGGDGRGAGGGRG